MRSCIGILLSAILFAAFFSDNRTVVTQSVHRTWNHPRNCRIGILNQEFLSWKHISCVDKNHIKIKHNNIAQKHNPNQNNGSVDTGIRSESGYIPEP